MRFLLVLAKISKRAPKPPDIYSVKIQDTPHISYYQHSKNHEISTNSKNIKKILGAPPPKEPPNPLIYTSCLHCKRPLIYPSINIQKTMRFLLILAKVSKISNPLIYTSFLLKFKTLLIYPTINFQHTMRFLLILAQISKIF